MKFIIALILTIAFAFFCRKSIKKHAPFYYLAALLVSLVTIFVKSSQMPSFMASTFSTLFQYGTVSTAMFTLVMYMNAFANGKKIQKTFMPIRAELSIIACILAYGHNIFTGKTYFVMLLTKPEQMSNDTIFATLITILLITIMTPLFITSFKSVRKKMNAKKWKKLQQFAYLFYMLIYVHIMCLMLPMALKGNSVYVIDVCVYSVVFLLYGTLRLHKYYKKSKKPVAIAMIFAMYIAAAVLGAVHVVDFTPAETVTQSTEMVEEAEQNITEEISEDNVEMEEIIEEISPYDIDLSTITDGEYTGTAEGYSGDVTVTVTMAGGVIENITLDSHTDDQEYMDMATWVRKYMKDEQKVDVDVVSGATYSSIGIKDAVVDALT